MPIFAENAPAYWAAGLPVMPLEERSKRAILPTWQRYCVTMPTDEEKSAWLKGYADGNIGLPLGPCAGLLAIDVDSDDPRLISTLEKLLPPSPWKRKGKKGFVWLFRYTDERTFRIRDVEENTIVECLSRGAQVVLPPSIHPDTGQPYQANCDLLSVLNQIPRLPPKVETLLRGALVELGYELSSPGMAKITSWVPAGARDNQMTAFAGLMSQAVMRGERSLKEAIEAMDVWLENYVERVAGDPVNPHKARSKVIEFFIRDSRRKPAPTGWDYGLDEALLTEIRTQLGEDGEQWDYQKFVSFAKDEFSRHEPNTPGFINALNTVISKIVHCSGMSDLEEQMLIRFLANVSNRTLTVGGLTKQINQLRRGEIEGLDHTEIAKAFVEEFEKNGKVRYHNTCWWQYRGAHWAEVNETEILANIATLFGNYPAARRFADHRGIMSTAAAQCAGELGTKPVDGINFANGFLTTDLVLMPHDPDYGKTYVLPFRYLPEAAGAMPKFMQFLIDCWGDDEDFDEKTQALREAMSATLFGIAAKFQRAICLKGVPHSGKSTLVRIVKGLLPRDSWCTVPPTSWDDRFAPAQMYGKLLNFAGELSEDRLIAGDMFKLIVEGSDIQAQHKNKPLFKMRPLCAHWFATNHLPKTRDSSAGFNRRWLFLEFTKAVPGSMKISNLEEEILSEEREAIVAWAVSALLDLQRRHDYTLPKSHEDLTKQMAGDNNSVRYFFQNCGRIRVVPPQSGQTPPLTSETSLYDAYLNFLLGTGSAKPVGLNRFVQRMQEIQGELGIKRLLRTNNFGAAEPWYEGVILVDVKAK